MDRNYATAMDVVPKQAWDLEVDNWRNSRIQNRLAYMQFNDLMEDRRVSGLLSNMFDSTQGTAPNEVVTPTKPTEEPKVGSLMVGYDGIVEPTAPSAGAPRSGEAPPPPPDDVEGEGGSPQPKGSSPADMTNPNSTYNRLYQIGQQHPELREAVYRRMMAENVRLHDEAKEYLGWAKPIFEKAIENGDEEALKSLGQALGSLGNPYVSNLMKSFGQMKVTGKNEWETVTSFNAESWGRFIEDLKKKNPEMAELASGIDYEQPVKVQMKRGKVVKLENVKDQDQPKQEYYKGLQNRLAKEHPDWTPGRIKFEAAKIMRKEEMDSKKELVFYGKKVSHDFKEQDNKEAEGNSYVGWTEPEKKNQIWYTLITGENPKFSWGDKKSYTAFNRDINKFMLDNGITPGQRARMKADYKARDASTRNQRKIYDMSYSFVQNLNQQIGKVKQIYAKVPRTSMRLLNIPIKALRTTVTGSGDEAALKSYLIEISNEIGKLSTGSAASIRELSESAQARWNKVHDETLSFNDIVKVLNTTQEQANMRIRSQWDAMNQTRQAIEAEGVPTTGKKKDFDISGTEMRDRAQEELKRRRGGR